MKRFLSLSPLLVLFALAACQLSPVLPVADLGSSALETASGVAFLPPVGDDVDTSLFFAGAELRYEIHRLEGDVAAELLSPGFATADGGIRVEDDHYHAVWKVRDTLGAHPGVTQFRVQVWRDDAGPGAACLNLPWDGASPCLLGHFDAGIRSGQKQHDADLLELTRDQSLPIKVYLEGGAAPTSIDQLFPLVDPTPGDPRSPFDPFGPNCMANEFSVPSQGFNALGTGFNALGTGFNALGTVGGLYLLEPGVVDPAADPIRLIETTEAGAYLSGIDGASGPERNAAILVVDDFGPAGSDPIYELGPDFFALPEVSVEALEDLVATGGFSHGALVLHTVVGTLMGAGFDQVEYADPVFRIFSRSADNALPADDRAYMVVGAVHSAGLDTDFIATSIRNALAAINYYNQNYDLGVGQIAINMSFVIIPCAVLEDFQASGLDTFEEYVAALGADNGVAEAFYDELEALLLTALNPLTDPLYYQVEACSIIINSRNGFEQTGREPLSQIDFPDEGGFSPPFDGVVASPDDYKVAPWFYCADSANPSIVYVASAGNFGQDFPLYPAAWPLVTSVSSQDAVEGPAFSTTRSSWANSGEVMAPGALYELSRDTSGGDPAWVLAYAGTSFAAPVVSVYTALDLMQSAPICGLSDRSWLAHGEPYDVGLPEAVAAYCPLPAP